MKLQPAPPVIRTTCLTWPAGSGTGNAAELMSDKIKKEGKMPGLDRSGPEGKGAMTGRRTGLCTGNTNEELTGRGMGFGRGGGRRRMGRGMGWYGRNSWEAPTGRGRMVSLTDQDTITNEIAAAKAHLASLEEQLKNLSKEK